MKVFNQIFNSKESDINKIIETLRQQQAPSGNNTHEQVSHIINEVYIKGDEAIKKFSLEFDGIKISSLEEIRLDLDLINKSKDLVEKEVLVSLENAYRRILNYQKNLLPSENISKNIIRKNIPIETVLIYAPGGKAIYPSSVLMAAGPAKAAGVKKIILTSPSPSKSLSPSILAACSIAGIDEVYCIGGAHAIAGFVFRNNSLPSVDKIVGPGNKYVAEAKRQMFGLVGIDLIAGPSEILIIGDDHTDPHSTALDLMAQAEHDEEACSILVSLDLEFSKKVEEIIGNEVEKLQRKDIIKESLINNGYIINLNSIEEAIIFSNNLAPEHLHIKTKDSFEISDKFRYAGTILIGDDSANAISDYSLGPSHILPTSTSARFSSQLSVNDFLVHPTQINLDKKEENEYLNLLEDTITLSKAEGLSAHALSASYRLNKLKD